MRVYPADVRYDAGNFMFLAQVELATDAVVRQEDTQRDGEIVLHIGQLKSGCLRDGLSVSARVDGPRRTGIRRRVCASRRRLR